MQVKYVIIVAMMIVAVAALAAPAGAAASYPMTVTDNFGRNVTIAHAPQRIVSLSSANTEILFALGAGGRIVGDTQYDTYPPEAANITHVGGFADTLGNIDIESIVNVTPDLIICEDAISEKAVNQLTGMGYPVIVLKNSNISMIESNIRLIGQATDTSSNATALVNGMESQFSAIRARTAGLTDAQRPSVLFMAGYLQGQEIYVYGKDTFGDELVQMAGGKNVVTQSGYPVISPEAIISADPDWVIIPVDGAMCTMDDYNYFKNGSDTRFAALSAIKDGHVVMTDGLVEYPGPRLPAAAQEVYQAINPGASYTVTPAGNATAVPTASSTPAPGFEGLVALTGLLGVGCLILWRKR